MHQGVQHLFDFKVFLTLSEDRWWRRNRVSARNWVIQGRCELDDRKDRVEVA